MAADEFLLDHAQEPTLRLYTWDRPCLSLGYAQKWQGQTVVETVRRPSGGRAVLHQHEWTYAMALPAFEGTLSEIYRHLTGLWLTTLRKLQPAVEQSHLKRPAGGHPSCYELAQPGEISLHGQKLVGSAQVRRGRRLLQHGSIPWKIDKDLFQTIFPEAELPAALGPLDWMDLVQAFPEPCRRRDWTPEEQSFIENSIA